QQRYLQCRAELAGVHGNEHVGQSLVAMASDCLARGETSLAEVLRVVQG
ncbi:MAG: hypothetical protein H5U33_04440, partial [Pseudomonas sp.]|nr:hypothetical protein [Pseudomonas sp.]